MRSYYDQTNDMLKIRRRKFQGETYFFRKYIEKIQIEKKEKLYIFRRNYRQENVDGVNVGKAENGTRRSISHAR